MTKSRWRGFGAGPLLLLLLGPSAAVHGQMVTASVTGTVVDGAGAALGGAAVVASNQNTGVEYPARSNEVGVYNITGLPVGSYSIRAEAQGFKAVVTNPLTLEVGQTARIDLKLEVGSVSEVIEVVGMSPILQRDSATVGEVITGSTASALPLNGRNTAQLTLLVPGAVHHDPQSFTMAGNLNGGRPYVNGNREQSNNFTLDGLDSNEAQDNLIAYSPSPEALAEIRVETNTYSAEFGNVAGAVVSSIVKSGTNEFHGSAFDFLRDDAVGANSWVNNHTPGATKAQLRQHIFGATLGGPLLKNKLFFFADYQGTRVDTPGSGTASVAPAEWRRGDFSSLLASGTVLVDPLTGRPFANNQIPVARFSPAARALLADTTNYPLPTGPGASSNYAADQLSATRVHQGDLKLDGNLSPNDNVFVRLSFSNSDVQTATQPVFPLQMGTSTKRPSLSAAANWTHTFGGAVVNELRLGFSRSKNDQIFIDSGGIGDYNQTLGIPGGQPRPGLSRISWVGSTLSAIGTPNPDSLTTNKVYQLSEKLSVSRGQHFLTAGAQLLHTTMDRTYAGQNYDLGQFQYNGQFTGHPFADFLLDQVSFKGISGANPWRQIQDRIGVFAQDDWKVSTRLTVNLGLRWEYFSPLVEANDRQVNYDLTTGRALFAGEVPADACRAIPAGCAQGENRGLVDPYYRGFAPRLGFAWTLGENTVVRGGYGIVQFMEGAGAGNRLSQNNPFIPVDRAAGYTAAAGTMRTGFEDISAGPAGAVGVGSIRAYQQDLRPQFTQQWNVFLERQLTRSLSAEVGYVGMKATHVIEFKDANQPLPGDLSIPPERRQAEWLDSELRRPLQSVLPEVTSVRFTGSEGNANYHGLQVGVRQRRAAGLEFLAAYTFSKAMQDNRGFYAGGWGATAPHQIVSAGDGYMNGRDPRADYGPSFFNPKHNFSFAAHYELPFGKDRAVGTDWSGLKQAALGGWNLSSILSVRSGFPLTVYDFRNRSLQSAFAPDRPDRLGDGRASQPTWDRWLDIAAFREAPIGTFGNSSVGSVEGPGYWNLDLGIDKRFALGGTRTLTLRAEAFNALNHPNKGLPNNNFADAESFGRITFTANAQRIVEFAVKLGF